MGKDDGANGEQLRGREGGVGERGSVCEGEAAWERRQLRGRAREGAVIGAGSRRGWIARLVPPVGASFCCTRMAVTPNKLPHQTIISLLFFLVVGDLDVVESASESLGILNDWAGPTHDVVESST
jgi:hypothetical protein